MGSFHDAVVIFLFIRRRDTSYFAFLFLVLPLEKKFSPFMVLAVRQCFFSFILNRTCELISIFLLSFILLASSDFGYNFSKISYFCVRINNIKSYEYERKKNFFVVCFALPTLNDFEPEINSSENTTRKEKKNC